MSRIVPLVLALLVMAACADTSDVDMGSEGNASQVPTDAEEADPAAAVPTSPIPIEPDGGIGDGAGPPGGSEGPTADTPAPTRSVGPPMFGVSSEQDSASVEAFAYCVPDGTGSTVCGDGIPEARVTLMAESQLVVTFEVGELSASSSEQVTDGADLPEQTPLAVEMENPGIWLVDISSVDSGVSTVWLSWTDSTGLDAQAVVDVNTGR